MESILNTNLMIVRFYKNFINDPVESLIAYHTRYMDEDDKLIDMICFASPSRCNMYGNKLTKINQIDYNNTDDAIYELSEYVKMSGAIDFLIYHQFNTLKVDLNKSLDDKDNFKQAYNECKNILSLYMDGCKFLPESYDYIIYDIDEGFCNIIK